MDVIFLFDSISVRRPERSFVCQSYLSNFAFMDVAILVSSKFQMSYLSYYYFLRLFVGNSFAMYGDVFVPV